MVGQPRLDEGIKPGQITSILGFSEKSKSSPPLASTLRQMK